MTVDLLLIRHAPHDAVDAGYAGRAAGHPLGERGRAEAAALARALAGEELTAVHSSPLERTRQTAAAIAAAAGLPAPTVVDALIEIDLGEWTGRSFDSLRGDPAWTAWNERRGSARIPGGETMAEAADRIAAHVDALARTCEGGRVAIVTHADMIRGAVARVLGLPLDHVLRFDVAPASVTRLVAGDWGARIVSLNERPRA